MGTEPQKTARRLRRAIEALDWSGGLRAPSHGKERLLGASPRRDTWEAMRGRSGLVTRVRGSKHQQDGGAFVHAAVYRASRVVRLRGLGETARPVLTGSCDVGVVGSRAVQRCGCHPIWAMRQRAVGTIVFRDGDASCSSNDRHARTAQVPRARGRSRFFVGTRCPFGTQR
jgi:hypothetical protein